MQEKIYWYFLILVGILSQESFGSFLDDDVSVSSSDLLDRKKRVINQVVGQGAPVPISRIPYIVNILQNGENHCVGTILSQRTVITAQLCVPLDNSVYSVHSASIFTNQYGIFHDVTEKKVHSIDPNRTSDGIALLFVHQPFVYGRDTGHLELYAGRLLPGTTGIVSGWGVGFGRTVGTFYSTKLRSINVPIIRHHECLEAYRGRFKIIDGDVCTYDVQQYCGNSDIGAPLVINSRLAGIHIWREILRGQRKPDVFINIQHADYTHWIMRNMV